MDLVRLNNPMLVFITKTKQPAANAHYLRRRLNLDKATGIDAIGLSGGIWAMWDSNRIHVEELPHEQQALHLIVKVISNNSSINAQWLISGIYASSLLENRFML